MQFNSSGEHNTAVGTGALYVNTASGIQPSVLALAANGERGREHGSRKFNPFTNTTGYGNSALGDHVEFNNGDQNTASVPEALRINSTGQGTRYRSLSLRYNSIRIAEHRIGRYALLNNPLALIMWLIGVQSQYQNTTGTFNTTIGNFALTNNHRRRQCVSWLGFLKPHPASRTRINIGNYGYLNAFGNQAFIGNLSTIWNGGNVTWSTYSDERVKTDVRDDVHGLISSHACDHHLSPRHRPTGRITGNKPHTRLSREVRHRTHQISGFLAQQVEQHRRSVRIQRRYPTTER